MSASNAGRVAVVGASGSGKSSYVKRLLKDCRRIVIFDPKGEYQQEGVPSYSTIKEIQAEMMKSFGSFMLAYVPPAGREARALNRLSHLCMKAQEPFEGAARAPELVLVVEEMNLSFPVHGAEANAPAFADICSRGRSRYIEVIGVTQRFAEVSMRFRGNLSECVIFRQSAPRDIKAAAELARVNNDKVSMLRKFEFIRVTEDGDVSEGKITYQKLTRKK